MTLSTSRTEPDGSAAWHRILAGFVGVEAHRRARDHVDPAVRCHSEVMAAPITDVLEDTTGRALHLVLCTAREPLTVADLTRRELMQAREQFTRERLAFAMSQSFSDEALEKRYALERLARGPEDETPAAEPAPDPENENEKGK